MKRKSISKADAPARELPPLEVELRALDAITVYERNAKKHPQKQIDELRASLREYGQVWPLLLDEDGVLIAGHGRREALAQEGFTEARVIVARGWTEMQKRAFRLLDNKVAENGKWDEDLLRIEIRELGELGQDISQLGWQPGEIAGFVNERTEGKTDPDAAPPTPVNPVSRRGDVWLLGRHRITCGDSTNAADVERLLKGAKPHLMVTDPPYGVKYDAAWRKKAGVSSDNSAVGKVLNDDRADWREAWALFPGDVCYIWHAGTFVGDVAASLAAVRFKLRAQIVWVKQRLVIGRGDYHHQHEPCLYGVKDGADEHWHFMPEHEVAAYGVREGKPGQYVGGRKQSTVWNIEHVKSETGHSTQKPIEAMRRPIENNSMPGDAIYEPFSGSGTTIIACEMTKRKCFAIELNPAYVDVAVCRWQDFTGEAATLEGDGRAFAQIARERPAQSHDNEAA